MSDLSGGSELSLSAHCPVLVLPSREYPLVLSLGKGYPPRHDQGMPRSDMTRGYPQPPCWTDKQTEHIAFRQPSAAGGNWHFDPFCDVTSRRCTYR